jgi:general secretion pathway protein L
MLSEFFRWWGQRLAELVPGRAPAGALPRRALLAEVDGADAVTLTLRRRGRDRPLGRFALDEAGVRAMRAALRPAARRVPVILRLPPGALLEREIVLPLAAEREAEGALRYEMDRVTPFRPDAVFWSWEVARRDRARGRLHLRLSLVPRAAVERVLAATGAAGAPADMLAGCGSAGTWRSIALAAVGWRPWQRLALRGAALACLALATAVVATPFVRQSLERAEVEERIAAVEPRAREADALRRRLAQDAASGDVVAATRAEFGDALHLLAALTDILPDDTHLTDLVVKQRQMTLQGQSTNASRLITLLSADAAIRDPAFAAPVTRMPGGGPDVFTITSRASR